MEKIIQIDGKDVGFKSSASFLIRYRDYFGADGLKELSKLSTAQQEGDMNALIVMLNMIWALAKNYNKKIPPVEDWLDGFENFDVVAVFEEVSPLLFKSLGQTEKTKEEAKSTEEDTKKK